MKKSPWIPRATSIQLGTSAPIRKHSQHSQHSRHFCLLSLGPWQEEFASKRHFDPPLQLLEEIRARSSKPTRNYVGDGFIVGDGGNPRIHQISGERSKTCQSISSFQMLSAWGLELWIISWAYCLKLIKVGF